MFITHIIENSFYEEHAAYAMPWISAFSFVFNWIFKLKNLKCWISLILLFNQKKSEGKGKEKYMKGK